MTGLGRPERTVSVIPGRIPKLRHNSVMSEIVDDRFLPRFLPSANRSGVGPIFSPDLMDKVKQVSGQHGDIISVPVIPEEDKTLVSDNPQLAVFTEMIQASRDPNKSDAPQEDFDMGTQIILTGKHTGSWFEWKPKNILSSEASAWSLKTHVWQVATHAYPGIKWYVLCTTKIYSQTTEDRRFQIDRTLKLGHFILQIGKVQSQWIQHKFGFSIWKDHCVPIGLRLSEVVFAPQLLETGPTPAVSTQSMSALSMALSLA